jgi:methylmalonyl-CoA mutase C-terminal domain/subunit
VPQYQLKSGGPDTTVQSVKRFPGRVLVAKAGLDGHDRGARVISLALRDAGCEVIYTGRHTSLASIAQTALEEDVDVIGLSILSGAHVPLTRGLFEELERRGLRNEVQVVVGGTIATAMARDALLELGVADVFPGGTPLETVVARMKDLIDRQRLSLGESGES